MNLTISDLKNANAQIRMEKWTRRWANSKSYKYKELVPAIYKNISTKKTARRRLSKILQIKSGHCMVNSHKSKINFETSPLCGVCQIKKTHSHNLLESNKFKKEREALLNNISSILSKKRLFSKMSPLRICWENKISVKVTNY